MAEKKFFVNVDLQGNNINNLRADTLDITSNLASANTKRIVYWSGQYYYSNGTSWIALGNTGSLPTGGATGDILAKASGTDYDVEWISNYTSTVQHEVKLAENINIGQAVYVSSANGTNMLVSKASNATEATSSKTFGLLAFTGVTNDIGFVITEGLLAGLDTSTATAGDPVWLGTNGNLIYGTTNKPVAPAHLVYIGVVTRVNVSNGEIFVSVQNGFELDELHNVSARTPSNNDGIFYNTTTSLWETKSITTVLGYTPVAGSGTTNYIPKFTASGTIGDSNIYVSGTNIGIGITNPGSKLEVSGDISLYNSTDKIGFRYSSVNSTLFNYIANSYGSTTSDGILYRSGGWTGIQTIVSHNFQTWTGAAWDSKMLIFQNGDVKLSTISNAASSTDKFLVSESGIVKYRTAAQTLSDIGGISLLSLSASAPLSYNNTSGAFTIQVATTAQNGYLSFADWNTFNGKVGGSGTSGYVPRFTASSTLGNGIIQDNGTNVAIGTSPGTTSRLNVVASGSNSRAINGVTTANSGISIYGSASVGVGNIIGVRGDSVGGGSSSTGVYGIAYDSILNYGVQGWATGVDYNSATNIGGWFKADNGSNTYSVQLQDGTEGVGKFLKCITADGKSNWATLSVADTGLTLTTTGTSGAATLVGNTLNIPTYNSSLIPDLNGTEIWRGNTFRNNSTTIDTTAGITLSTSGTNTARSVATTSYATRSIRMGVTASVVATGRYSGMRGSALLWYVTGGFLYTGEFNISDTATATGTHNFWGLASSTSDLVIGDVSNSQPSALTNIIAFANDSGDSNLQIMYNDATGTATKTDLGASFPSNRTAGAAITSIYSCFLYNAPNSSNVIYRIVNKETGAVAQGTLSSNLPASTVGLNFFGVRTMGTSGGGVTNSGQFDVYRLGVYSL